MHVCVCMHAHCVCVCVCLRAHICVHVYVYTCMLVSMGVCVVGGGGCMQVSVCVCKLHFYPCQCHPWQEEIQSHEEAEKKLQEQVQSLTSDVETQHGQLLACRQQIEQLKLEKEAFYKGEGGRGTHQGIKILIINNN